MTAPRIDVLVGTGPTTITKVWDVDGTPADVGAVTYRIVDANGTEVVATTAATKAGAGTDTTYSFQLPRQDELATAEWKRLLEEYEDPGIDPGLDEELRAFVERRAAERER